MRFITSVLLAVVACWAVAAQASAASRGVSPMAKTLLAHLVTELEDTNSGAAASSLSSEGHNSARLSDYSTPFASLDRSQSLNSRASGVYRSHERLFVEIFSAAQRYHSEGEEVDAEVLSLHEKLYDFKDALAREISPRDASYTATPEGAAAFLKSYLALTSGEDRASPAAVAAAERLLAQVKTVLPPPAEVHARRLAARKLTLDPAHPSHVQLLSATAGLRAFAADGSLQPLASFAAEDQRALLGWIVAGEPATFACQQCKDMVRAIRDIASVLAPEHVVKLVKPICATAAHWLVPLIPRETCDPAVEGECTMFCEGMLESWGPSVTELIIGILADPRKRCHQLKVCPAPDEDPVPQPTFPATIVESAGASAAHGSSRILQFSDVHLDEFYEVGSRAECKMPVCCRGPAPAGTGTAGTFGHFNCDAPDVLIKSCFSQIPLTNVSHVVFTGDSPAHDLWMQTKEGNIGVITRVTDWAVEAVKLATHVQRTGATILPPVPAAARYGRSVGSERAPQCPRNAAALDMWTALFTAPSAVKHTKANSGSDAGAEIDAAVRSAAASARLAALSIAPEDNSLAAAINAGVRYWPVLGNHAAAPVDQYGGPAKDHWLYGAVGRNWARFLPPSAVASFVYGGYYTAVMEPGLHVIGLQTNYYDPVNLYLLYAEHPDLGGQLGWLEFVLAQIEAKGEKALIIGHEPVSTWAKGYWPTRYLDIITRYAGSISATLFGHVHSDHFHVVSKQSVAEAAATRSPLSDLAARTVTAAARTLFAADPAAAAKTAGCPATKALMSASNVDRIAQSLSAPAVGPVSAPVDPASLTPVAVEYIPSSVSPIGESTNPSFRVYVMNPQTKGFTDYEQYRADLLKANARGVMTWEKVHIASQEYGLKDLSPQYVLTIVSQFLSLITASKH